MITRYRAVALFHLYKFLGGINMNIKVEKRHLENGWVVSLNRMDVRFTTHAQAQAYADQLHARLNAPYTIPTLYEEKGV
jgi:hypothetical protein